MTVIKLTLHITRMVWVIAFSSPDSLVISSISLCDQIYFHLSKFRYRDYSCCRDKINRAAIRRAVVMVFASPSGQFYLNVTIRTIYRDSVIWTTLSWYGNPAHLPGLCKNSCQPWHRRQLPIPPGRWKQFWKYTQKKFPYWELFHIFACCFKI